MHRRDVALPQQGEVPAAVEGVGRLAEAPASSTTMPWTTRQTANTISGNPIPAVVRMRGGAGGVVVRTESDGTVTLGR